MGAWFSSRFRLRLPISTGAWLALAAVELARLTLLWTAVFAAGLLTIAVCALWRPWLLAARYTWLPLFRWCATSIVRMIALRAITLRTRRLRSRRAILGSMLPWLAALTLLLALPIGLVASRGVALATLSGWLRLATARFLVLSRCSFWPATLRLAALNLTAIKGATLKGRPMVVLF